jgi:hypothetical protein
LDGRGDGRFALAVFAVQTAVFAQLFVQAGALLSRRRRSTAWLGLVGALSMGVWFGLPSAFAAVTEVGKPDEAWEQRLRPAAVVPTKPAEPPVPMWASLTPAAVTAEGIAAAAEGRPGSAAGSFLLSCVLALVALAGAARLYHAAAVREATSGGAGRARSARASAAARPEAAGAWGQVRAAAVAEFLNLTRDPAAHVPLRWPAALLFAVFFGWMAPNLDPRFPYENMRDLSGMGGLLYVLLWQMQLLTDRFGNDAGTAGLLFSFPAPRVRMLLGRNIALGGLLLLVDGCLMALMCAVAGAPRSILPMLLWLPAILLVLTALGNVVSAMSPFPIRKRGERFSAEPDRSLAFLYVLVGVATWALLWPLGWAVSSAQAAGPLAGRRRGSSRRRLRHRALRRDSLVAARLLGRREARTVRILDRDR